MRSDDIFGETGGIVMMTGYCGINCENCGNYIKNANCLGCGDDGEMISD